MRTVEEIAAILKDLDRNIVESLVHTENLKTVRKTMERLMQERCPHNHAHCEDDVCYCKDCGAKI